MLKFDDWMLSEIQIRWQTMGCEHSQGTVSFDESGFLKNYYVEDRCLRLKRFHKDIDRILMAVNCYYCKEHPNTTLTCEHLCDEHEILLGVYIL